MIAELRTFLVAAQLESFAATADKVGLTQSAVSAQIRRLELEFGYALFHRTGRAVHLSKPGLVAMERAAEIVALFDRLRDISRESVISGTIKVGVISTAYASLLAPAMSGFIKDNSNVLFSVSVGVSMGLMQRLEARDLDVAVIVKPPFSLMPDMQWSTLATQSYVLVVHEQVKGEEWRDILRQNPFIRYDSRSFGGSTISAFLKENRITTADVTETEEISLILDMTSRNAGVAIIPSCSEIMRFPAVRRIEIPEFAKKREIGIMTYRSKRRASLDAFVQYMADESGMETLS
ncbi:LysR family transcriptional regulator [Asaia lannensis]|uniref:LysR family transcriptional regulator n=1 Tax=Asaia lannensis TaxID=415421 RepID=UPI001C99A5EB